jgi:hypothetical protein
VEVHDRNTLCLRAFSLARALPRARRTAGRSAYTLLEVILALALTTVILGLVGMAMHIHLSVADKSRGQVEEAQLARTLLQHIAEDLRNSIPFSPTASSSSAQPSGGTSSSGSGSLTGSSASILPGSQAASGSSTTSDSGTMIPSGIYGTAQCLQMDTSRRVRPVGMPKPISGDTANYIPLSDVKTVTYSLGDPGAATPSEQGGASSAAQSGLYRREVDRMVYVSAMQQGQADILTQATASLAPEVVNVQFTYYDGTTTYDQWDSNTEGKLPIAIKVAIMIRRAVVRTPNAAVSATADNSSCTIYDMLVDLPNAFVQASQGAGQSPGSPSATGAGGGGSGGSAGTSGAGSGAGGAAGGGGMGGGSSGGGSGGSGGGHKP